jgi:YD repeat-containing protein
VTQTRIRTTAAGSLETLGTTYAFDELNRLVETTRSDGSATKIIYNALGQRDATLDPLGRRIAYGYDEQGRLSLTHPDGVSTSTTYDPTGRITAATDERGNTTTFTYDANGRTVGLKDPRGDTTTFAYDAIGRRTRIVHPDGSDERTTYGAVPHGRFVVG